jgi:aryl-alcohol dehydrogenase-like predicted oxidoreductase
MLSRPIPSTGQMLPVIGLGTWRGFDIGTAKAERAQRAEVLRVLFDHGGAVIDSSPMYGRAEAVTGDLLTELGLHERAFVATKVWTQGRQAGIAEMQNSLRLLRRERIELMQVHNLVDWRTHLPTLRAWKAEGRFRYIGVTHYTASAHEELAKVLRAEPWDFVQLNYSLDDRNAERKLLPLAAERGIAVLVNRPLGGGGLMRSLRGKPLPDWAGEIDCASWSQLLLKFILGHPAVTCVIPGTASPEHMADNCRAGLGRLPDAALRQRIAEFWAAA